MSKKKRLFNEIKKQLINKVIDNKPNRIHITIKCGKYITFGDREKLKLLNPEILFWLMNSNLKYTFTFVR